jgi:hypothetical protein
MKLMAILVLLAGPAAAQPLQNRLLIATSTDGLAWQRTNIVFCDSADVPDAVLAPDGRVFVYYQGLWTHTVDGIMVGMSPDGISDWTFYQVEIPGTAGWPGRPCDPDIIVRGDTFRLYFTGDPTGDMQPETYSAVSADGVHFSQDNGIRFQIPGSPVLDPSLLRTGDTLQYFAGGAPQGANWHAHSMDGLTFTRRPDFFLDTLLMANGISAPGGGYRFYTFVGFVPHPRIRSVYSPDDTSWSTDPDDRLVLDTMSGLESQYVKDPAVVFKDSLYLMYYVTRKPAAGVADRMPRGVSRKRPDIGPNPCRGMLLIRLMPDASGRAPDLSVFDPAGRLILTRALEPSNPRTLVLDLRSFPSGIYFCRCAGVVQPVALLY